MVCSICFLLKYVQPRSFMGIFPDSGQSTIQTSSPYQNCHEASHHNNHLKCICPDDSFQSSLKQRETVCPQSPVAQVLKNVERLLILATHDLCVQHLANQGSEFSHKVCVLARWKISRPKQFVHGHRRISDFQLNGFFSASFIYI